jgi:hypothetical protein
MKMEGWAKRREEKIKPRKGTTAKMPQPSERTKMCCVALRGGQRDLKEFEAGEVRRITYPTG